VVLKYLANSQYVFPHNFHVFESLNKAIQGCMFKADGSVQKVGVQWFSHQPKELFADGICFLVAVPSPLNIVEWV